MRDKRMTEFTGRQMVIRLAPTRRVLVGKDVTHSDAVHDASVYGIRDSPITLAYAEGYTLRGGTL